MNNERTPYYYGEDEELVGYVAFKNGTWQAQTLFGLPIAMTSSRKDAEELLEEQGLAYLSGVWRYFDTEEQDWFPCVITEAFETKVIVRRTNELGYDDPDLFKRVVIAFPDESSLVKTV